MSKATTRKRQSAPQAAPRDPFVAGYWDADAVIQKTGTRHTATPPRKPAEYRNGWKQRFSEIGDPVFASPAIRRREGGEQ